MTDRRDDSGTGSVRTLLWCIPLFLIVHNAEEALTMPSWLASNLPLLRSKFFFFNHLTFSSGQLYISLFLVTIVPLTIAVVVLNKGLTKNSVMLMLTLQSVIGWNAVVPHVTGTILLGIYNPGLLTAVVINIPFTFLLFKEILAFKIINTKEIKRILMAGAVVYLPLVYLNHVIAENAAALLMGMLPGIR
jgi:hypothetical protein